jgi:hypothetical protein
MSRERNSTSRSLNYLTFMSSSGHSSKTPTAPEAPRGLKALGAREGQERQIDRPTNGSRPSNCTLDPADLERLLARLLLQILLGEREG